MTNLSNQKFVTHSLLSLVLAATASFALAGCETSDDRSLAAGQACLDSATTAAQANSCTDLVSGLTSQEASLIRCSANFVAQGLTGARIANAVANVNKTGTSTDATTGLIAYLVFTQTTPTADTAITNCTAAGSKAMLRLATAAEACDDDCKRDRRISIDRSDEPRRRCADADTRE